MKIYLASSWRNEQQPEVLKALRDAGHEVYDFRNPSETDKGFAWSNIDPNWQDWTLAEYNKALQHPIAQKGFDNDFNDMKWADACVMLMPCGRSAHVEAGWMQGAGKPTIVLQPNEAEPELMYKMFVNICTDIKDVLFTLAALESDLILVNDTISDIPVKDYGYVYQPCHICGVTLDEMEPTGICIQCDANHAP